MEGPGINNYLVCNYFYWGHRVERIKCRQGSEDFPECIPGISFRRAFCWSLMLASFARWIAHGTSNPSNTRTTATRLELKLFSGCVRFTQVAPTAGLQDIAASRAAWPACAGRLSSALAGVAIIRSPGPTTKAIELTYEPDYGWKRYPRENRSPPSNTRTGKSASNLTVSSIRQIGQQ